MSHKRLVIIDGLNKCREYLRRVLAEMPSRQQLGTQWRPLLTRAHALVQHVSLIPRKNGRSLVGRLQLWQFFWGIFLYVLAVGGLWWTSNSVIEGYFQRQALQWIIKLDDMGTPLYVSQDKAQLSVIKKHVSNFPEIAFVRYYTVDGGQVLGEYNANPVDGQKIPPLSQKHFDKLRTTHSPEKPYLFDNPAGIRSLVRASAPVWIKSIRADGLLGFDMESGKAEPADLIGFIEVGLDFSRYQGQLAKNIALGSVVIAALLFISMLVGRLLIKRALQPLSDLQKPLANLARGEIDVTVRNSGPQEIIAISSALNTTVTALKERDEKLRKLAHYDPLTGLANRRYFVQQLQHEVAEITREGSSSALLFIDLDEFKSVNDTRGHAAGDRLLVRVAAKLKRSLRKEDLIARFGGDEFVILGRRLPASAAGYIARSVNKIMQDIQFIEGGQVFNIHCSIGVTLIDSDRFTPDELLAQADMACYEAKSQGRNCYQFYEPRDDSAQNPRVNRAY